MLDIDLLTPLIEHLDRQNANYALVGGVALIAATENARPTVDIDFLTSTSAFANLPEAELISQDDNFARYQLPDGTYIDLRLVSNPVFKAALENYAKVVQLGKLSVRSLSLEGLFALKLYAMPSLYRQGNFAKFSIYESDSFRLLLENREIDCDRALKIAALDLLPLDVAEMQTIIQEQQEKVANLDSRFQQ